MMISMISAFEACCTKGRGYGADGLYSHCATISGSDNAV